MTDVMSVIMPDGNQVDGIPVGTPKAAIMAKYQASQNKPHDIAGYAEDIARSIPGGIAQGLSSVAGIPGDIRAGVQTAGDYITGKIDPNFEKWKEQFRSAHPSPISLQPPTSSAIANAVASPSGGYYEPKSVPGRYAETAASFVPAALGGEAGLANIAKRLVTRAVLPGVGSEAAGEAAQGTPYEGLARVAGAVGGSLPVLGRAGFRAAAPALTSELPQDTANLVQSYEGMGGNLRPGQYNPSRLARAADTITGDLPFNNLAGLKPNDLTKISPAAQADQYNSMLANTFGSNASRLTPDVLEKANERIGNTIGSTVARNTVKSDLPLTQDLADLHNRLQQFRPALNPGDATKIEGTLNHIYNLASAPGGLDGKVYQSIRQRGGLLDALSSDGNPTVAKFGQDMRGAIDDAFARQASPQDAAAIVKARQQYRALKTIEPIALKAPAGDLTGNGAGLLAKVVSEYGNPNNAGNLGTLARAGKEFIGPYKSSGTAENAFVYDLFKHPGQAMGRAAGATMAVPYMGTVGRVITNAINTPEARRKALGQLLQQHQARFAPQNAAMLGAILRSAQGEQ